MTRPRPPIVEPLGTGALMPAVFVGYVNPTIQDSAWSRVDAIPPYLVEVHQQAGGMAMSYPTGLGVLMRLEANRQHALRDPSELLYGFHCMAEDPKLGILARRYPLLRDLCATWGENYSQAELRALNQAVAPYFRMPSPIGGLEAFALLDHGNPLDYFANWTLVRVADGVDCVEVEQASYGALWRDSGVFKTSVLRSIQDVARALDCPGRVRCVLLWENAD